MKKIFFLSLLALSAAGTYSQNMQPLALGSKIPMAESKMKSVNGKEYSISGEMGKNGVLVMFSCNTCPYVVRYQERTRETIREAKANGLGVVVINSNEAQRSDDDSYASMQAYAKAQGYSNIPYVVDDKSAVANAFGATRTPELFLFNKSGVLVYHGAIDDNHMADGVSRKHINLAINELVSGKDISVKESRSVGCTIKRI
jgi:thioredoxin-related protein